MKSTHAFSRRAPLHISLIALFVFISLNVVQAQESPSQTGVIQGTVSTQSGSVKLPGVLVTIRSASDQEVAQQVSNEDGQFSVSDLAPARYRVLASLDGFQDVEKEAVVTPGKAITVALDLPIATVTEHVDVKAAAPVFEAETLASSEQVATSEAQLIAPGQGVPAALRLMTGVIEVPGGDSIDGGRPFQAGVQIGAATLVDPATNVSRLSLPDNGVDSVSVLPNPYEVEWGRFSSGLVVIDTKRAANRWKIGVGNLEPALRLKRFTVINVTGITVWQPDLQVGGPIVKDRVFFQQTAQYHYQTIDIPSRPEVELKHNEWYSTLTRIDANLSPRHSLAITGGMVPSTTKQETLGTFVPPDATVNITDDVAHGAVTERALLGKATSLETTVEFHQYRTGVAPQGPASMTLLPETTLGNFFNAQHRHTAAVQWVDALSHSYNGFGGIHLLKAGVDVLHSSYDGMSDSRPVLIDRSNGTLARRLDFDGASVESVHTTDVAAFAQDRLQLAGPLSIEFGGRIDRDGVTESTNGSPRAGVAWRLNETGTATLHGGLGYFYERTPSVAAAFTQFEAPVDTRFATDGVTPLGPPVAYGHVTAPDLESAHSRTWDIGFDHHLNRLFSYHLGVLDRAGSNQLVVEPVRTAQRAAYVMSSTGHSRYRQQEVTMHLGRETRDAINASYVHSSAQESLNALMNFFDVILQPVIDENAYAPAMADAPNRFLLRGRAMPTSSWLLIGTVDWRSGLPYSVVNDTLEFVGPRNVLRFPTYFRVDAGFERRLSVARIHPWVGLRISNALNSFLPSDVQANLGSPAFGSFYNSVYREYRIRIRIEK